MNREKRGENQRGSEKLRRSGTELFRDSVPLLRSLPSQYASFYRQVAPPELPRIMVQTLSQKILHLCSSVASTPLRLYNDEMGRLLVAQGDHGIDLCGTPGRKVASQQCGKKHQRGYHDICREVGGLHVIELIFEKAGDYC